MIKIQTIQPGTRIALASGRSVVVIKFLDRGSQGDVYLGLLGTEKVCLKVFNDYGCTLAQRKSLARYAKVCRPSISLVDILDVVPSQLKDVPAGYVMEYVNLSKLKGISSLLEYKRLPSLANLVDLGIVFALCQRKIHAAGYGYHDYSDGNIKWDFESGDIFRQLDIDNLVPQGVDLRIQGTPGYIAPEVGRGKVTPSVLTDAYGISLCLFMLLHGGMHPLHGRAVLRHEILTPKVRRLIEIANPCFVFDPQRDWNRPSRNYQGRLILLWHSMPQFMKAMFVRAFTVGLTTPELRVTDSEWMNAFVRLRGLIECCPKCKSERFVEPRKNQPDATKTVCTACKTQYGLSPRILFGDDKDVVLKDGNTLLSSLVGSTKATSPTGTKPVARVVVSKGRAGTVSLQNTSRSDWVLTAGDRKRVIAPNKNVAVAEGNRIIFPDAALEGIVTFS